MPKPPLPRCACCCSAVAGEGLEASPGDGIDAPVESAGDEASRGRIRYNALVGNAPLVRGYLDDLRDDALGIGLEHFVDGRLRGGGASSCRPEGGHDEEGFAEAAARQGRGQGCRILRHDGRVMSGWGEGLYVGEQHDAWVALAVSGDASLGKAWAPSERRRGAATPVMAVAKSHGVIVLLTSKAEPNRSNSQLGVERG